MGDREGGEHEKDLAIATPQQSPRPVAREGTPIGPPSASEGAGAASPSCLHVQARRGDGARLCLPPPSPPARSDSSRGDKMAARRSCHERAGPWRPPLPPNNASAPLGARPRAGLAVKKNNKTPRAPNQLRTPHGRPRGPSPGARAPAGQHRPAPSAGAAGSRAPHGGPAGRGGGGAGRAGRRETWLLVQFQRRGAAAAAAAPERSWERLARGSRAGGIQSINPEPTAARFRTLKAQPAPLGSRAPSTRGAHKPDRCRGGICGLENERQELQPIAAEDLRAAASGGSGGGGRDQWAGCAAGQGGSAIWLWCRRRTPLDFWAAEERGRCSVAERGGWDGWRGKGR
ncbi:translation initiation factor IF-2-like [Pipistrellus kuhlii]|uniref:translation initiation factor IF-2-like n=1 Tax=Pipistrellus kuhlii TaxID=59472 RepID=UPI001E273083|nr:translation initiation factor IF-2-like [Pipistrellus kuhlii]